MKTIFLVLLVLITLFKIGRTMQTSTEAMNLAKRLLGDYMDMNKKLDEAKDVKNNLNNNEIMRLEKEGKVLEKRFKDVNDMFKHNLRFKSVFDKIELDN
jgi:hypothetical protein